MVHYLIKIIIRTVASMLKDANSLLVIDESFIDFVGNDTLQDNEYSMRSLINEFDNIIVVHSFTKFYAVPGLRIGAAFSNPQIIDQLNKFIPTWSVNTFPHFIPICFTVAHNI